MPLIEELAALEGRLKESEEEGVKELAPIVQEAQSASKKVREKENVAQHVLDAIDHLLLVVYSALSRLGGENVRPTNAPELPGALLPTEPPQPEGTVTPDVSHPELGIVAGKTYPDHPVEAVPEEETP